MRYLVGLLLVVGLAVGSATVSAHGNHLTADDQASDDGTVVIENLFVSSDSYVVLHAADGGESGRVIGHKSLDAGFHTDVRVRIEDAYWNGRSGDTSVRAVLHEDDGDGQFETGEDSPLRWFGRVAATQFRVEKRDAGAVNVVAAGFGSQSTNGPTVTVERVELARDGYLVVHADGNDSAGRIVGRTALDAGVHRNVSVAIDPSFYSERDRIFPLWAAVRADDGDGQFEAEADAPVTVRGSPVMSEFTVHKADGGDGDDGSLVNTPEPTTETTSPSNATPTTTDSTATTADVPGFGVAVALAALVALALFASRVGGDG